MSLSRTQKWLLSNRRVSTKEKAKVISVASGKGGVGKTSVAIKIAKELAGMGQRTLLIDCDYNLSNTFVKLGLPISNNFYSLLMAEKSFEECIYRDGNFHLLSGCNGNYELFERGIELDKVIIDIIVEHENDYDYIILDCPAGLSKAALTINAYSDYRFIVVTPDKSSITDSYSLIKILKNSYGITENHLVVNKMSSSKQYQRIVKTLSETVENFLDCRISVLGGIGLIAQAVDLFDTILLKDESSPIHEDFLNLIRRFVEGNKEKSVSEDLLIGAHVEQDVQLTVS